MNNDDGEGGVHCSPGPFQREDCEVKEEDGGLCECQGEDVEYEGEPEALFERGKRELVFCDFNWELPGGLLCGFERK